MVSNPMLTTMTTSASRTHFKTLPATSSYSFESHKNLVAKQHLSIRPLFRTRIYLTLLALIYDPFMRHVPSLVIAAHIYTEPTSNPVLYILDRHMPLGL
jgi:hypothetical protein